MPGLVEIRLNQQGDSPKGVRASSRATASEYFLEHGRSGAGIGTSCGRTWAAAGLAGCPPARGVRRRGGGMGRGRRSSSRKLAAHGMPMLIWGDSPANCGNILSHHGSRRDENVVGLPDLADGSRKDGLRADRARRPDRTATRSPPPRAATATGWTISAFEVTISRPSIQCDALLLVARTSSTRLRRRGTIALLAPHRQSRPLSFRRSRPRSSSQDNPVHRSFSNDVRGR